MSTTVLDYNFRIGDRVFIRHLESADTTSRHFATVVGITKWKGNKIYRVRTTASKMFLKPKVNEDGYVIGIVLPGELEPARRILEVIK